MAPRLRPRLLVLLALDAGLTALAVWGAFALRLNLPLPIHFLGQLPWLLVVAEAITLPWLLASGWYRGLTRASGSRTLYDLLPRSLVAVLLLLFVITLAGMPSPPRSFWPLLWLLLSGLLVGSRIVLRDLGRQATLPALALRPATVIYGAGAAGQRLARELLREGRVRLVAVLDDDSRLWGRSIEGVVIAAPSRLPSLVQRHGQLQALLALPSLPRPRRLAIAAALRRQGLQVLTVPSLADLAAGRLQLTELQPLSLEELLGREPGQPLPGLLAEAVTGCCVLVTGAGGSIGSELCREALRAGARRLVLVERSEAALYLIQQRITDDGDGDRTLAVLLDACDARALTDLCRRHRVDVLVHAAAYKHVPLVESNPCSGLLNNIRCTQAALAAARAAELKRFVLVSSDKAVRPTNVMGASKRICEQLVQCDAARGHGPVCAIVRFGNVLGSSGSVVPRFRAQIEAGGPVTVTHPEVTRYFMTVSEAVQLVLQAAGLARGGEVFVLDMGEPVRIVDLARQMILLSGCTLRDADHPDGEIAIRFTGLRPGEKLREELLISPEDEPTLHPRIRRAREGGLPAERLLPAVARLLAHLSHGEQGQALALLPTLVPDYAPVVRVHALPVRPWVDINPRATA
jgi:FlaA1/EpsC-like NDP-sugar epimerase